jgi:hypothetical protein
MSAAEDEEREVDVAVMTEDEEQLEEVDELVSSQPAVVNCEPPELLPHLTKLI